MSSALDASDFRSFRMSNVGLEINLPIARCQNLGRLIAKLGCMIANRSYDTGKKVGIYVERVFEIRESAEKIFQKSWLR
jgi:hypothetical protein